MSQMAAPFNPIGVGGGAPASDIAANLQNNAQRAASLAIEKAKLQMAQEQLKAQEKMAQEQLNHTASEHEKYQQFQAQQNQQGQQHEMARLQKEEEFKREHEKRLIARHEELTDRAKKSENEKRQLNQARMRSAAGISSMIEGDKRDIDEEIMNYKAQAAALDIDLHAAMNTNGANLDKLHETLTAIDGASGIMYSDSRLLGNAALEKVLLDAKENPGYWEKVRGLYGSLRNQGSSKFVAANASYMTPAIMALGDNISSFFGGKSTDQGELYGQTAATDVSVLSHGLAEELAKSMQGMAKPGKAGEIRDALKGVFDWGSALYIANKSGGSDKQEQIQKNFEAGLLKLKEVLPDQAIQGIMKLIEDTPDAMKNAKDPRLSSIFKSDNERSRKVLESFGGISQAFHATVNGDSPVKVAMPSEEVTRAFNLWVGSKAMTLSDPELFMEFMQKNGVEPKTAAKAIKGLISRKGQKDIPELRATLAELEKSINRSTSKKEGLTNKQERLNLMEEAENEEKHPNAGMDKFPNGF